jgi:hypothetical protein
VVLARRARCGSGVGGWSSLVAFLFGSGMERIGDGMVYHGTSFL